MQCIHGYAVNDVINNNCVFNRVIDNSHSLLIHVIDCFWFGNSIFPTSVDNGNELYILLGSLPQEEYCYGNNDDNQHHKHQCSNDPTDYTTNEGGGGGGGGRGGGGNSTCRLGGDGSCMKRVAT